MSDGRLQALGHRIDALNLRERAMLTLILVLLLWAFWQLILMAPLGAERKALLQRSQTAIATTAALNQSILALAQQRAHDPRAEQTLKLERLAADRSKLDGELAKATSSLVDPKQMGAVLDAILARQQAVRVVGLSNLPAEPLSTEQAAGVPRLYKHGMRLELEGGYLDLLQFLHALDALPWDFIWSDLELSVDENAACHLRLTLHTLSLEAGWLGV